MLIYFEHDNGNIEVVNTDLVTPQLPSAFGPYSKQITYPTFNGPSDYSFTGPYYGADPNENTGETGATTPVESQLTATDSEGDAVGPTGSPLFPLGAGGAYIYFYRANGVLDTRFPMDDATAAADGFSEIATALAAADAVLYLYPDGTSASS